MKRTGERVVTALHDIFTDRVTAPVPGVTADGSGPWIDLFRVMVTARHLDRVEAELVGRGEAFFHCACSGHEGLAALAGHLTPDDWFHLHYRDKALMLALGVEPEAFLNVLLANRAGPSAGRQMSPFFDDPARHILSQNAPVGDHALQAVGVAAAVRDRPGTPLVVCSMGEGSTQQGQVLEALAEAVRSALPVLFLVEDNGYSISTPTAGRTFYSLPDWAGGAAGSYLGLPIQRLDGRDPVALAEQTGALVASVRTTRRPALAVVRVERLCNHTNADDERVYRPAEEIARVRAQGDPIRNLRERLITAGLPAAVLDRIDAEAAADVEQAAARALMVADPEPEFGAKVALPERLTALESEYRGTDAADEAPRLTMLEAIRGVLRSRLEADPRVSLYGEDIEDPKGDVFGVTRGLSTSFPGRVVNSPLSETTILGASIGRALAGERPVAFLQFADFLPIAYNQIVSELGNIHWRSAGGWSCPVIVMVACGAYRPGLGPFHAQTFESILAHVPGIDVLMPSNAADAAGLLNAAFESPRPTVFLYPKIGLNDRERTTSTDIESQLVPIGRARFLSRGDALTLVTWGSTVRLGEQAAAALAGAGCGVDLIDLRSISPWDVEAVCASARRTGRLLVVHEDNRTCGFGAEVVATVAEALGPAVECRRVTRPDTYVPCNFANQLEILPSLRRTLETAAEMLGLDLAWERPPIVGGALQTIEALGPSPADQRVTVLSWSVRPGEEVRAGQKIAEMEADKAVFDMVSPASGRVAALLVAEGESVATGAPLLQVQAENTGGRILRPTREDPGTPRLRRREEATRPAARGRSGSARTLETRVGLSRVAVAAGSRVVTNDELLGRFPDRAAEEIVKKTGIEQRQRLAPGETVLTLATRAARQVLETSGLTIHDVDALICCTTTPPAITPALACQVLFELGRGSKAREIPAHDISAACCGYLYALGSAYDLALARPEARVLVVSAEALSPLADPDDFDTAILFGDAATATLVSGPESEAGPALFGRLHRPVLSAKGEPGDVLRVPTVGSADFIHMNGLKVYAEAVRRMIAMLDAALADAGLTRDDLDLVVPHQANARIIHDIRQRMGLPPERFYINIGDHGNTSSSSIPLCLSELAGRRPGERFGLTAFGGGYTFAAAILERADADADAES